MIDAVEERAFCVEVDSQTLPERFAEYVESTPDANDDPFPLLAYEFMKSRFPCKR